MRRITDATLNIANVRAYAPDDFPYLEKRPLEPSPSMMIRAALELQKRGDIQGATKTLLDAKRRFDFARCECSTNLAVIYYTSGQKEQALEELESAEPLVNRASRPDCLRAQYLLGSLYREMSRTTDAERVFGEFLVNSQDSTDPEIVSFRKQISQ